MGQLTENAGKSTVGYCTDSEGVRRFRFHACDSIPAHATSDGVEDCVSKSGSIRKGRSTHIACHTQSIAR